MNALLLQAAAVAWFTGAVCLAGVAAQAWKRKPGRHRAVGMSTAERAMASESYAAAHEPIPVLPQALEFPELRKDPDAPMCPPMYPPVGDRYAYSAGVGRYAHLRIAELDATAERNLRRRGLGESPVVDLQKLRVRGAVPTVAEVDDEWWSELSGVAS